MSELNELNVALKTIEIASEKLRSHFRKNIVAKQKIGFDIRQNAYRLSSANVMVDVFKQV